MVWVEAIVATGKTVGGLGTLAKSSPVLLRFLKRTYRKWRRGQTIIPVFGSGGAGKSTAARVLAGQNPMEVFGPYSESWWTEAVPLTGDVPGQIMVAPGQLSRAERHWPELLKAVVTGKAVGLINVVAFGYHSLALPSYKEHDLWSEDEAIGEFLQKYIAARQDVELALLDELLSGLGPMTTSMWMVTLVNKQDLWWDRRDVVRKYYENGPYAQKIEAFRSRLGRGLFQHEFLPVSMAIANLTSGGGEVLANTAPGYDLTLQQTSLANLSGQVRRLVEL